MRIQACVASISSQGFYFALGLPTIGPGARIHQAQHNEGLSCQFLPLQLPPSPYGPSCLSGRSNRVTVQYSWGWRFKVLGVDGFQRGWRELRSFVDRLSSIYEIRHVSLFDWIFPQIEASLRLPCISYIYIYIYISHFSSFISPLFS